MTRGIQSGKSSQPLFLSTSQALDKNVQAMIALTLRHFDKSIILQLPYCTYSQYITTYSVAFAPNDGKSVAEVLVTALTA